MRISHAVAANLDMAKCTVKVGALLSGSDLERGFGFVFYAPEAKLGICRGRNQALTEDKRSISVIGWSGDA